VKTGIANPLKTAGKPPVLAKKSAKPSPAKRKGSTEALTAYAIGATLGKLAVKAGLATPARSVRKRSRLRLPNGKVLQKRRRSPKRWIEQRRQRRNPPSSRANRSGEYVFVSLAFRSATERALFV